MYINAYFYINHFIFSIIIHTLLIWRHDTVYRKYIDIYGMVLLSKSRHAFETKLIDSFNAVDSIANQKLEW